MSSPKKDESGLKRKVDNDGEMYSKNIRVGAECTVHNALYTVQFIL